MEVTSENEEDLEIGKWRVLSLLETTLKQKKHM